MAQTRAGTGGLDGRICIVTGASRGVGKGVALALAAAGATVYASARTGTDATPVRDPEKQGSLEGLERDAQGLPGRIVTRVCDHADDGQTEGLVGEVVASHGQLDILVNNAWPGYEFIVEGEAFTWGDPFWRQPMWRFDAMIGVGLRAAYCASRIAASAMVERGDGLIVNISYWAARKFIANTVYGVSKAATDKMSADMAHELRPHGVAAVSLYPGIVRTEAVMLNAGHFDLSNSESPEFVGRVIAALAQDAALMDKSGGVHVAAALAREYGLTDIDGKRPEPLTLETA